MLIEVFKTGLHKDSNSDRVWTEEDLDTIVAKYNPAEHEAPVVIGHPKDNAPAYGWVERLERRGNVLYAKLKDLVPEFVEAVKKGLYKKRSISLYPDLTLRHIGFLGAMPPAVKGLRDVSFSETDACITIELSELSNKEETGMTFIEKLKALFREEGLELSEHKGDTAEFAEALKAKELEFAEVIRKKDEEISSLRQQVQEAKRAKDLEDFDNFCDGLIKEGKLTPAQREKVKEVYKAIQFAEPADSFKALLSSLPVQVQMQEMAKGDGLKQGTMSRAEFLALTPDRQHAFIFEGGIVTE